jgi:glycolate oxidase FAD binding subunit
MSEHHPSSEAEVCAIVRAAASAGDCIEIIGGGTRSGLGRPVAAQHRLKTGGLSGITAYNPAELVMTVAAGTPMREVEAALTQAGQRLPFEPMDHRALLGTTGEPTIGGVIAGNIAGPRRFVAGAARDSLLGVRFVNGHGEVVRNGGRVMKNVTGLDLVKLMAGSWGTLGVLTEVTVKVLPVPESETTLIIHGLDDADAMNALAHAMATSNEPSGAAHLPALVSSGVLGGKLGSEPLTLLRVEGFEWSVRPRIDNLKALLGSMGQLSELTGEESRALWRDVRDCTPFAADRDKPLWRLSMAPSQGHEATLAIRQSTPAHALYDWQGGLVWLQMEDELAEPVVRAAVRNNGGGHATLIRAEPGIRRSVPVFEPEPMPVAALSARIKQQFDPSGVLNPGRMVAGV